MTPELALSSTLLAVALLAALFLLRRDLRRRPPTGGGRHVTSGRSLSAWPVNPRLLSYEGPPVVMETPDGEGVAA